MRTVGWKGRLLAEAPVKELTSPWFQRTGESNSEEVAHVTQCLKNQVIGAEMENRAGLGKLTFRLKPDWQGDNQVLEVNCIAHLESLWLAYSRMRTLLSAPQFVTVLSFSPSLVMPHNIQRLTQSESTCKQEAISPYHTPSVSIALWDHCLHSDKGSTLCPKKWMCYQITIKH